MRCANYRANTTNPRDSSNRAAACSAVFQGLLTILSLLVAQAANLSEHGASQAQCSVSLFPVPATTTVKGRGRRRFVVAPAYSTPRSDWVSSVTEEDHDIQSGIPHHYVRESTTQVCGTKFHLGIIY